MNKRNKNPELLFGGLLQDLYDKFFIAEDKLPSTDSVLQDMSLPVLENMRKGNHEEFKRAFLQLIDAHVYLLTESGFEEDRNTNYSLLPARKKWIGFSQFREWNDTYRQIIIESVKNLESDYRFYHTCCHYLIFHLYARIAPSVPTKISQDSIVWAVFVFITLSNEIQKQAVRTLNRNLQIGETVPLPAYLHNLYDPELKRFIGTWEDLRREIARRIYDEEKDSLDIDRFGDMETHLRKTVLMTCRSVSNGDAKSSEWVTDSLLRWNDGFLHLDRGGHYWDDKGFSYTYNKLGEQIDNISLNTHDENNLCFKKEHIIAKTFQNFWFDISIIAFGVLIDFANKTNSELARDTALQIYNQQAIDTSSRLRSVDENMIRPHHVFKSYLRFITDYEYASIVSKNLGRGMDSPMQVDRGVVGRPYVWSGGDYAYETFALLLVILAARKGKKGALSGALLKDSIDYIFQNVERYERVINSYSSITQALNALDSRETASLLFQITGQETTEKNVKNHKRKALSNIRLLRKILKNRYYKNIGEIELSADNIKSVENYFQEKIFGDIQSRYPVNLFSNIEFVQKELSEKADQAFTNTPRELFLKGNPLIPEDVWPNKDAYVREYNCRIPYWPLQIAIQKLPKRSQKINDPYKFWSALTKAIDKIREKGQTPIILSPYRWPQFIQEWDDHKYMPQEPPPPKSFTKSYDKNMSVEGERNYQGHLYDTPVLHIPVNFSFFILAKEQLHKLRYKQYENGNSLQLSFTPYENMPHKGTIKAEWQFDFEVTGKVTEIKWEENPQDK